MQIICDNGQYLVGTPILTQLAPREIGVFHLADYAQNFSVACVDSLSKIVRASLPTRKPKSDQNGNYFKQC